METKPLLFGIMGFLMGGLLVSVAATTFDRPDASKGPDSAMTMEDMTASLKGKTGDDFDKAFIVGMIEHHQGAIDMAKLSEKQAKHEEIKALSEVVIAAQEHEIAQMKEWQRVWHYDAGSVDHSGTGH